MESLKHLTEFFRAIQADPRISITHIGIYAALLHFWTQRDYRNPVDVFSYEIMGIAKVTAYTTYFKIINDLSDFGYIKYVPSFKKNKGSKVYFLRAGRQ